MNTLTYLVSLITADNDYQLEQAAAAETTAHQLGINTRVIYAGGDSIEQSQQLLNVIQSRTAPLPTAMVVEPAGSTALPKVAEAAARAGIGWVLLNHDAAYLSGLRNSYTVPICAVSADHTAIGRLQGRQLAALLPRGGTILYIQGPSSSSAASQRLSGIYQIKSTLLELKILKAANWTEAGGYQAISSWLRLSTSHEEKIALVAAQNDLIAHGAKKAFDMLTQGPERDRWLSLPFIGIDGLPKTGQSWVRDRVFAATVVVPPLTPYALKLLVEATHRSVQPPEHTLIPPESFPSIEALSKKGEV